MPVDDQYRVVRNRIRNHGLRESLYVVWAYAQFLQIRDFRFPNDIEVDAGFLRQDPPQLWIAEWTLEQLARESIMHAGPAPRRNRSILQWAELAECVNRLRTLEQDLYRDFNDPAQIHLELMRISHRQFVWQQQRPNARWFIRYFKLFSSAEIDALCREVTGLSVREIYLIGMAMAGVFLQHPRQQLPPRIEIPGLDADAVQRFLSFTASSLEDLSRKLKCEHALDESYAYRYSSIRQYPLVEIRHRGRSELACPIPTLLFWRITSGLYYELTVRPEFFNHFGSSFQSYIGEVLGHRITTPGSQVIAEAEYHVGRNRKDTVDWIVIGPDHAAVFIECKTMRLTWASKAGLTDLAALQRDIAKLAEGVVQVYRTIRDYREGHYPTLPYDAARPVLPLIVTLEDWYFFGHELPIRLDAEIRRLMEHAHLPLAWLEHMPYSIMSADEFETASGLMNAIGPARFIDGKVRDDELRHWAFHGYCRHRYREEMRALPTLFMDEYEAVFEGLAPRVR